MPGGLKVTIPAGAVTHAGTLSGSIITAPIAAPPGMALSGPVYELHLTGTVLKGHADLTVPVPASRADGIEAGPNAALLVYYDAAGGRWRPAAADYNPAAHTLSATVGHLSVWSVLQISPGQVLAAASSALKAFFGVANSAQPACPGSGRLTALGVKVTSDPGDLVRWCADDVSTVPVLRVANDRTYAMEADYRSDWSASLAGSVDPLTAAIVKSVPALSLRAGGPGVSTSIIPGGQELDVTARAGTSGVVLVGPSVEGIIVDAMLYAADTLAMTFGDIPGTSHSDPQQTAKAIAMAFEDGKCVAQMDAVVQNPDVSTPQAAATIFRDFTDVAAGCLAEYWPAAYGISGTLAAFITGAALWLADGIKLVVTDGHAIIDNAIYWQGYHIYLRSTSAAPIPDFYYANAVLPEKLYASPQYPKELAIDNHDGIAIQALNAWGSASMTMTGVLTYDECQPACAAGPIVTFPVQVVASAPQKCTLQTDQAGSSLPEQAYVYSKISVIALSGNPPSSLVGNSVFKACATYTQQPTTQQSPAPFTVTSSSPTSGPASGGTLIVIHGSGFSSVTNVVMNSTDPPLPEGSPNYYLQNLHPTFSVVSDSEIDVTTTAGAAGFTYEIDFTTPTDEYFRNTFPGIPLFTYE